MCGQSFLLESSFCKGTEKDVSKRPFDSRGCNRKKKKKKMELLVFGKLN